MHRRNRHRRSLNFAVGRDQLHHGPERLTTELPRNSISPIHIRVHHSQEANRLSLLFEFFVHAGMVASKNAHADDGDRNRILGWQVTFSVAGCRKEIVNAIPRKITKRDQVGCSALGSQEASNSTVGYVRHPSMCTHSTIKSAASCSWYDVPYRREDHL